MAEDEESHEGSGLSKLKERNDESEQGGSNAKSPHRIKNEKE